MVQSIVAGCVAVVLIIMALIGYAQERHECWNGHVLKNWRHRRHLGTSTWFHQGGPSRGSA